MFIEVMINSGEDTGFDVIITKVQCDARLLSKLPRELATKSKSNRQPSSQHSAIKVLIPRMGQQE